MLEATGLTLRYGSHVALDDVSISVGAGEILAVLGPSGSGKSSLLRCIAGLERPEAGSVSLDGQPLDHVVVEKRQIGYMFQDYALFPHLDVAGNVAFGLRMQGATGIGERVRQVLDWVDLEGFGARSVDDLSGGERQRVALARALAPTPRVLMLDEPVGALDRALRARLVPELAALLRRLDLPAIYVTHDQDEAFAIADTVAVLDVGRLIQSGPPVEVWRNPVSEFVARFLGYENIADVQVANGVATTPWGAVPTDLAHGAARVAVRPEALSLDAEGDLVGEVTDVRFVAGMYRVAARCLRADLIVHTQLAPPTVGEAVTIAVQPDALHRLD